MTATAPAPARGLITVDGIDGSGKSVLARRLLAALGPAATLLAVDDFRRPVDFGRGDRSELDLYWDERYDFSALSACVQSFLDGEADCQFAGFEGASESVGPLETLSFAGKRWLIVEGVFVGRLAQAARGYAVFVDVPRDEAYRRLLERDVRKGRAEQEVRRRIEQRYFPAHDRYLEQHRPRSWAHLLLDNRTPTQPRVIRTRPPGPAGEWAAVDEALAALTTPATADRRDPGAGAAC